MFVSVNGYDFKPYKKKAKKKTHTGTILIDLQKAFDVLD